MPKKQATGIENIALNTKERRQERVCQLLHNFLNSTNMLKIIPLRLEPYIERELLDMQAGFRTGRGTRDIIADVHYIIEKAMEFKKEVNMCFIDYSKAFDCVYHIKLIKMGIPEHLIVLMRNL